MHALTTSLRHRAFKVFQPTGSFILILILYLWRQACEQEPKPTLGLAHDHKRNGRHGRLPPETVSPLPFVLPARLLTYPTQQLVLPTHSRCLGLRRALYLRDGS